MKTAQSILDEVKRRANIKAGVIECSPSQYRRELSTAQMEELDSLAKWIEAKAQFDADAFSKEGASK